MEWTVEVENVERVGPKIFAIALKTPAGLTAHPGQFVLVRAHVQGNPIARHYTISSPRVGATFEITVESMPDGTLSRWLADLRAGSRIRIEGPFGRIYYDGGGPVAVIAGGVGIGAAVGIGERALQDNYSSLVVAHADPPVHEARLARLASAQASVFATTRRLDEAVAQAVRKQNPLYVFGFRPFIDRVQAAIETAGGDPAAARIENYGSRE